jgi:hypothetical protein
MGAKLARLSINDISNNSVLHLEEFLGRELIHSLSKEQKQQTIFSRRAPSDITSGTEKTIRPIDSQGIRFSDLDNTQKKVLLQLIKCYLDNFEIEFATKLSKKLESDELSNIIFTWAGGLEPGEGHYYRILTPSFLIEYDNTQDNANHIHSVIRDLKDDFGGDLLLNHYKSSDHHN